MPFTRPRPVSFSISQHGFILDPSLANNTACAILNRQDASVIRPQHTSDGVCECRSTRPFTVLQVTHSIRDAHASRSAKWRIGSGRLNPAKLPRISCGVALCVSVSEFHACHVSSGLYFYYPSPTQAPRHVHLAAKSSPILSLLIPR